MRRRWPPTSPASGPGRIIAPDTTLVESLTSAAATAGITGGGTYDALVGLTAHAFGHELLSLDQRPERTYRSLGVTYRLLGTSSL
jgi:hypothetical protein